MWLSRAGVIEQAVSAANPTISSAVIAGGGSANTINFVTSENCTYTSTTGITVTTNTPAAVTVTAVSGTDTAGAITLSRNIVGGEVVKLIFAATNGVTSQATGLPIAAVTFPVTNNATPASTPQFSNFIWASTSAATSVTSDADGTGAIFPTQSSGLAVQFPNWVGYGAAGAAVTDTSIKVKTSGFGSGFTAGNDLTNLTCSLFTNQTPGTGGGFQDSGTPYFTGTGVQSRSISLNAGQLSLIGLPTITNSGKLSGLVEFDILSLLSTAFGTTITLNYTDAIPASNTLGGNDGTQTSSFFLRVAVNGVDDAGQEWAQELDVRTSEANPYDGGGNLSGPITAVPTLVSVFIHETDNPDNIVGQAATAANNWDLGTIASNVWPNGAVGAASLSAIFQANPYIYNNPISVPDSSLVFDTVSFTAAGPVGSPEETIRFVNVGGELLQRILDGGVGGGALPGETPPIKPTPLNSPAGNPDGGFRIVVSDLPSGSQEPLIPTKALDGSPPGPYPIQITALSDGGLVEIVGYSGLDPTQDNTAILPAPGVVITGQYLVV